MQKKKKILLAGAGALLILLFLGRKPIKRKIMNKISDSQKLDFINKLLPSAQKIGKDIGVPPFFILAQICLESAFGRSELTSKYFNFGGIKAVGNQPSKKYLTTECKAGVCKKVYQNFAIYPNVEAGLKAQSKIYQNRYFKQHLNKTKNPIQYAKLLQSGTPKYATALNYVSAIEGTLKDINRLLT